MNDLPPVRHRSDGVWWWSDCSQATQEGEYRACGIGLPIEGVQGDLNGLRLGTPEIVRWGMGPRDMGTLAGLIADVLKGARRPEAVVAEVSDFRRPFTNIHHEHPYCPVDKPLIATTSA